MKYEKKTQSMDWFVTYGQTTEGGLSEEQCSKIVEALESYKNCKYMYVVKELYNKYGQHYPHIHACIWTSGNRRQDSVQRTFKGFHPKVDNIKDIDVRPMMSASTLVKGYLTKQGDSYEVLYNSIPEETLLHMVENYVEDEKKIYPLKGKKIPTLMEAPYCIVRHAQEKGIELRYRSDLNLILYDMASGDYVMLHLIRKRKELWFQICAILGLENPLTIDDF